jgi:hypothetical protein
MACSQTTARTSGSSCPTPTSGIDETKIWLFNRADATFTGGTNQLFTDITMTGVTVIYPFVLHNKGVDFQVNLEVDENTGARSWTTELTGKILAQDSASWKDVKNIGTDLGVIVLTRNNEFLVGGYDGGMYLKAHTSGLTKENYGHSITIGNDEGGVPYQLLDTDYATTLALLVGIEL